RRHLRAWAYGNDGTSGDAGGNIGTGRCSPQLRPAGRAAATAEVGGFSRRKAAPGAGSRGPASSGKGRGLQEPLQFARSARGIRSRAGGCETGAREGMVE